VLRLRSGLEENGCDSSRPGNTNIPFADNTPEHMAFNVFDSPGEAGYFSSLAVGGFLSIIAVALRFVAARHVGRKLAAEDWFALAAGAILVLRCILGIIGTKSR
jgi:hypothetical protein